MNNKNKDNSDVDRQRVELSPAQKDIIKERLNKIKKKEGIGADNNVIKKAIYNDTAPLSSGQRRLWYLSQLGAPGGAFNIPIIYKLSGKLDIKALTSSLQYLVDRHEVLRTVFASDESGPFQKIEPTKNIAFEIYDYSMLPEDGKKEICAAKISELIQASFNNEGQVLWKFSLIKVSEKENILCLVFYHAIFDGHSCDIFYRELCSLYHSYIVNNFTGLIASNLQYADFSFWQQDNLNSPAILDDLNYWKNHLSGDLPILEVPPDYPRPLVQSYNGDSVSFHLSRDKVAELTEMGRSQNSTLYMVLLSVYCLLLGRYTGQNELIVGTPVAGRPHDELNDIIGFFANTLALRLKLNRTMNFRDLLNHIKDISIEAFSHQQLPFERIVEELRPPRDLSHNPVYQTLFAFRNKDTEINKLGDLDVESLYAQSIFAQTDLSLWVESSDTGIEAIFEYSTALFSRETILHLMGHYSTLIDSVLIDPTKMLHEYLLIQEHEKNDIEVLNSTEFDYPKDISFVSLLSMQSSKRPGSQAVVCQDQALTYAELEDRSNQLANYLQSIGVLSGDLVGVCINRSVSMLVGLLGILKAGAGYVPLDPEYPEERLRYMMSTSAIKILVTEEVLLNIVMDYECQRVCLDTDALDIAAHPNVMPNIPIKPCDTAYVIFTSGSTGLPKGVEVSHGAVNNFLHAMAEKPSLSSGDRLLAVTTLSFDIAVLELYLPLLVGATTVIATKEAAIDGDEISALINNHDITVMQATPSTWRLLILSGWSGASNFKVLCGGENFPRDLAGQLLERCGEVWNMYGPTETTVWSTCYRITDAQSPVLIGRPIANTKCYIFDEDMQTVPIGIFGELYIGGDGIASGYIKRPDLTEERFVQDPFRVDKKLYRTGDLVRWRHDGNLEYSHRIDNQVKLRGFRIELGEIESVLNEHDSVKETAVVVREDRPGDQRLTAYFVLFEGFEVTATELRSFLREQLPAYMVPQWFVELGNLPLTPNGKIDRKALPPPMQSLEQHLEKTLPRTASEKEIADVWCQLLDIDEIGVEDNFFDLGGHSLLAIQFIYKIRKNIGLELSPSDILFNTLEQLGSMADGSRPADQLLSVGKEESTPKAGFLRRLFKRN